MSTMTLEQVRKKLMSVRDDPVGNFMLWDECEQLVPAIESAHASGERGERDMKPLYIFDLDGTLALIEHRRHILERKDDPRRWREFYALCDKDHPNTPVLATMERLRHAGAEVWFFSGRSDEVRDKTVAWLAHHTSFMTSELEGPMLTMRMEGDFTPDDELKRQWFDGMLQEDKNRLVAVFDDRDRVVAMWRSNGVACFQVAEGEF